MSALPDLDRLLAESACRDLVMKAARCTDAQDHDGFAALFAEDAVVTRPGGQPLQGREAILASYRARPKERITRHLVSNCIVEVVSAGEARATSCVQVWSATAGGEATALGLKAHPRVAVGEFDDRFVFVPGQGWRISQREARFVMHSGGDA